VEEKAKLPAPLLIGILIVIIVGCAFFAYKRSVPDGGGRTYPDTPEMVWMKKKSLEVGGDWSKFTPEEQERAQKLTGGRGPMTAGIYGKAAKAGDGSH
jgi:hypothetical protein